MAKDPALLWYFSDWQGGTVAMSRHLKGCYMDLLAAQFNIGAMSIEEIKTVLGTDFGSSWPALQKKFKFDNGLYFNERLQAERDKRKAYSESRRSNRSSHVNHMSAHMEDVNENKDGIELPEWLNKKAWAAWEQHRKEKKKSLTPTSKKLQLKLLSEHVRDHTEMIRNSITNGWTGLFPLNKGDFRKPNKYVEPNYDKETNDRRNALAEQLKVKRP